MMKILIASLLLLGVAGSSLAAETRTWEGTWVNRKYGTKGPLKCVATENEDGTFTATFSGSFEGDPFSYDVTFQSKKMGRITRLGGTAVIRGHDYQWGGQLRGVNLIGEYKSSVGYFGAFELKETTPKK